MLENIRSLFNTIENDDLTRVKTVYHKVKNINEVAAAGFNALTRAVKKSNIDIIKMLIKEQKNVGNRSLMRFIRDLVGEFYIMPLRQVKIKQF
ncbi:ankyrin repeat domain-containing protein [Rickettsiella massiliensis]|uniref:ankyrin repeat domain-containing protein n=1 Tax=Rickettsiella massiliensis TaxID=676517 RepID=UPI0005253ADD|nr:ankyrin repeat domain-containing protein [Rickettsiella massiliensis]